MDKPVMFTPSAAQRIADTVKRVEGEPTNITQSRRHPIAPAGGFHAKITSAFNATTGYAWIRQKPTTDGKSFEDYTGITGNMLFEAMGDEAVAIDTIVYIHPLASKSYICYSPKASGLFLQPVKLTQTGGVAGNKTTPCSFTYTVKDIADNVLLTAVGPVKPRLLLAPHVAATWGTAYQGASGWVLYEAFETLTQSNC